MAVAWIGNRDAPVQHAVEQAAELLAASRCPVISIDTDIHGTRAAIALAERIGAAYDHPFEGVARETATFTDRGGIFVSPGEVRRRADVVVVVGDLPAYSREFVSELAETVPDLAGDNSRSFFSVTGTPIGPFPADNQGPVTHLSCKGTDLTGTVAALRAHLAGRRISSPVENADRLSKALGHARFTAFLCSGAGLDDLALEMVQGLAADLNKKARASILLIPTSEAGWGSVLVSTWTTGLPLRTSFSRGAPEFDPWRWNVGRMIEEGEVDLHLWIGAGSPPAKNGDSKLIALTKTGQPVADAAITIPIGEPGADHDAVLLSARTGTLAARPASEPSRMPAAATVINSILEHLDPTC
ncbi:formylmethanofuran dehydrogenase subunit B /formyltransferase/hydrolase complex subunit B [Mesorhizobium sp. J18]|uniref:tungsten formylmethanofuran dehydrogenase n=1 Tax=Mesorhizobium sp. J18 TaxID=935263 RepID=UPI0011999B17|nr:tungsten formylmethanofuran dehydrogenase [Mesorhizobium sp. J18]TWG99480.1 formylmethanofuran dehydrogenase subunit B /formyltransferase/hydrolase complex subunit B [Mesorhizobium sp. J18]